MNGTALDQSARREGTAAARLDEIGWGSFFIWIGVALLAGVSWSVFFLGTGAIMVSAQMARKFLALKVDRFGLSLGIAFVCASVLRILDLQWDKAVISTWLVPVLFIAAGASIVLSAWLRKPRI